MELTERLAQEQSARLAAERLLAQRSQELRMAKERLAQQTRSQLGQNSRALLALEKAMAASVQSERRLWQSIDSSRDGFAVFDADHRLVMANRAFARAFRGFALQPGMDYAALLQRLIDRRLVQLAGVSAAEWVAQMLARLQLEPIPAAELQLANGGWIRLEEHRSRDGDLVCLAIDITEQMRIWAAIEAIPDGFVVFDREDRLVICNQSYRDIYSASADIMQPGVHFEEILRHGLTNGEYPEATGHEEQWVADRMQEHRSALALGEHQLKDGRWLRSIDKATPDGGRVGLRVDITQLRSQQLALDGARRAAEAANRAKSAFLANMSHEIRTPMNGVVSMAELLCDTGLTDEQRLFAETIRSSGEALLVIINDILDYSKIEAERLTLHPEPFDLERLIHEVTMLLQPRAQAKGLDLMIDFDVLLPTLYIGDPGRLRQVLTNLLGNAVKFTDSGHVLTRVVGIELEDGRQQLHVTVEDSGIGICSDQLDHIFGEFNQVEQSQDRKYEGTGLGLSITRRLIERMGGAVWVDSEPGKGSAFGFRVTLPLAESAVAIRPPVAIGRALVVDDRFINRTILERQLVPFGIGVTLCRSGAEALAALAAGERPDVVLTDHHMPDMDGITLAGQLRAAGHLMPVLLLSSSPAAARDCAGIQAVDVILQKPVLRSELYRQLRALTASHLLVQKLDPRPPAWSSPAAPPDSATEVPAPEANPEPKAQPELRRMRVLAAEDNMTNQLVFQKMVRGFDIELVFAANGREAVEQWLSFAPDVIFMDISMPEMDGKAATRAIRAAERGKNGGRHTPIVALTAHAMEGDAETILAAGVDAYLTKPLRRSAIAETLQQHCPPELRDGLGPIEPPQ